MNKGAPRKALGGLDKVLYVRVDKKLLERLDRVVAAINEETAYTNLSRSDIARRFIFEGLRIEEKKLGKALFEASGRVEYD